MMRSICAVDGKHTVFGSVLPESMELVRAIEACGEVLEKEGSRRARLLKTVTITDCGQL